MPEVPPPAWNAVKYEKLTTPQREALQAIRAAYDGQVRWSAVELPASRQVELTVFYVNEECRKAMLEDPSTVYTRRTVIGEDGLVIHKEIVAL